MDPVVMELAPNANTSTEDHQDHLIREVPALTELLALVPTSLATDNLLGDPGIEMHELNLFKFYINESSKLIERGLSYNILHCLFTSTNIEQKKSCLLIFIIFTFILI